MALVASCPRLDRFDELRCEGLWIKPAPSLDPPPVLVGDERGQLDAIVVRGDGRETTAPDPCDATPLGLDSPPRLGVIRHGDKRRLARTNLQRKRSLTGLWKQLRRIEPEPDLVRQPQPIETGRLENHRIESTLTALAETRIDIAAQRLDRESRLERQQLRPAASRRRAAPHASSRLR